MHHTCCIISILCYHLFYQSALEMAHTVHKSWPLNSKELTIWSLSPPTIKNWVLWIYSYISDIKAKVIYAQNSSLPNYSTAYSDPDLIPLYLYGTLYSVVHHYAPLPDCLLIDFTLILGIDHEITMAGIWHHGNWPPLSLGLVTGAG